MNVFDASHKSEVGKKRKKKDSCSWVRTKPRPHGVLHLNKEHWRYIMSKLRTLISITVIFSMSLTPIYGYAGDATHYGMENHIVAQPPVVGAVLKSLGDNQFCISSTIGKPELVPSIFTEANKSYEQEITDIIDVFSSMGVPFCPPAAEKTMREEIQYVNTSLVDSKVYSNQKGITLVDDRIRGGVNNDIKIKTGELFHFQAPSFISITNKEMVTSMETTIEKVQDIYTRVFSSNHENSPQEEKSKESSVRKHKDLWVCLGGAFGGTAIVVGGSVILLILTLGVVPDNFVFISGMVGGLFGTLLREGLAGSLCGMLGGGFVGDLLEFPEKYE